MNRYKVKAYYKDLLRKQFVVVGIRQARAYKRVLMADYGFTKDEVEIIKVVD